MMTRKTPRPSANQPPLMGTWNSNEAMMRMTAVWSKPTSTYGASLPIMTSIGCAGVARRLSIVPRSISRVTARDVIITSVIDRITPSRPGTML